jgi:hypothetical protein
MFYAPINDLRYLVVDTDGTIRSESGGDKAEIAIAVVLFQDIRLRERAWRANDFAALEVKTL